MPIKMTTNYIESGTCESLATWLVGLRDELDVSLDTLDAAELSHYFFYADQHASYSEAFHDLTDKKLNAIGKDES